LLETRSGEIGRYFQSAVLITSGAVMLSGLKLTCLAAAILGAATVLTGCADGSPPSASSPPPASAPGSPLQDPPELVSQNGLLQVRLVMERRQVNLGGRTLWALTYNGMYMPPTLRFNPGDRLELALVNNLGMNTKLHMGTNLHTHGLHVSPQGNSDNVFLDIEPGQTFNFFYQFPANEPSGTYWYHPHHDPVDGDQVAGGMSGIMIVDGLQQYLPPDLRNITEHVIALKDFQVEGDTIKTHDLSISAPTNRTVNGQINPIIQIRPGEVQLWRLANLSANIYYDVQLPGQQFTVIGHDGNPVGTTFAAGSLLLAAANRFDVLGAVRPAPPSCRPWRTTPDRPATSSPRRPWPPWSPKGHRCNRWRCPVPSGRSKICATPPLPRGRPSCSPSTRPRTSTS
jgi:FtsP/CotA-like multicopper oxidase with cupredoxin domain